MRISEFGQNSRLLIRSYFIIVFGLLVVAFVLDLTFGQFQDDAESSREAAWAERIFDRLEDLRADTPPQDWPEALQQLERFLPMEVEILPATDVIGTAGESGETLRLFGDDGSITYARYSTTLNAYIHLQAPRDAAPPSGISFAIVPALFYASIFVLVGIWLRPLLMDIDRLTGATREFAKDYRNVSSTYANVSTLKELARSVDQMTGRINTLIGGQKDMTAALSHEMRTPIARVRFALAVMKNEQTFDAAELDAVESDIAELEALISRMLEYARLDHPDLRVHIETVSAQSWLNQVVRAQSKKLQSMNIELTVETRIDEIRIDRKLMELVVSNLLTNAMRYARQRISVQLETRNDEACLAVEDDGCGIPPESREAVFSAFKSIDSRTSEQRGGFGLGLAIVRRVAALHGGLAHATESASGGARIEVRWPNR